MNDQITTRDEFRRDLAALHETLGAEYERAADNLMHGAPHIEVFGDLARVVADARHQLERLLELIALDRLTDLATTSPARPLEAVLADIQALGHLTIRLSFHHGSWYLDTDTGAVEFDRKRQADPAYVHEYRQAIEMALSWGEDPVALAVARLTQIRELHAEYARRLERDGVAADVPDRVKRAAMDAAAVHLYTDDDTFACGPRSSGRDTVVPSAVTCPACQDWLRDNAPPLSGWPLKTGEVNALTTDPYMVPTEERSRWNVWSKDSDGDWSVTNSNLNQEQAFAAVRRLMQAALVHGPDGAAFSALPVGHVPGGPPVDDADALVFLNPDPEVPPSLSYREMAEERAREADRVIAAHPSLRDDSEVRP